MANIKHNDSDKAKQILDYQHADYYHSKKDKDYRKNLNRTKNLFELKSEDDCISFYQLWFEVYNEVKENWL